MHENPLHLDNQLCFSIYACSREVTRFYRPYLEEMGITYPQYITLLVLWEQNGITVKEIGERLFLDSGTLTPMLKRMEGLQLVKRIRSKEDERKVCIELTEQGSALKKKACSLPQTMASHLGITTEDYTTLLIQLNKLIETMKTINDRKEE
ncbi:MarR family winged helix-turn-helix transcriptional regulator [Bacillus rhizoplanae]|uniref:MarR family winged helix-turn-helix transcriptional regulator n=1 Tax=Bacillus rhizoplanae TaxID=2880966 RepID=UPI003D1E32AC